MFVFVVHFDYPCVNYLKYFSQIHNTKGNENDNKYEEDDDYYSDEVDDDEEEEEEDSDVSYICKQATSKESKENFSEDGGDCSDDSNDSDDSDDNSNTIDTTFEERNVANVKYKNDKNNNSIEKRQCDVSVSDVSSNPDDMNDGLSVDSAIENENLNKDTKEAVDGESFVDRIDFNKKNKILKTNVENNNDFTDNTNENKNKTKDRKSVPRVVCDSGDNLNSIVNNNSNENVTSNTRVSNETESNLNNRDMNGNVNDKNVGLKLSRDTGNGSASTSFVENGDSGCTSVSFSSTMEMHDDNGDDTCLASFSSDNRSDIDAKHTKYTTSKTNKSFFGQLNSGKCVFLFLF